MSKTTTKMKIPIWLRGRRFKRRPHYSYSALSTYLHCPYQFWQKYILKKRAEDSSLALSLGSLLHKGKELISKQLMAGEKPDYGYIEHIILHGYEGADKATGKVEKLAGVLELKELYWDEWHAEDTKSHLTYEEKLENYFNHLADEENDTEWHTIGAEVYFSFLYENIVLFGYIDNISMNSQGQLRVLDYKSSKKPYSDADIKTPLQMVIYNLAVQRLYPDNPVVENLYDFVLIDQKQLAGTNGWMKRGERKLAQTLEQIKNLRVTEEWTPKPTPLCHWCSYCRTNPNANKATRDICRFYSLWTPENKTFEVAAKFDPMMMQLTKNFKI